MHIPAEIARRRIDAVAAAEQPKALTAVCFDAEIVAHSPHFSGVAPPFAMDALRAVPCDHAIDLSAPDEPTRWVIGKQCNHIGKPLGPAKTAHGDRKSTRLN